MSNNRYVSSATWSIPIEPAVACDRVFAVRGDYEQFLREQDVPLHTIGQGIPLHQLDLLGISIGYELAATNILQVLELGRIPLHAVERTDAHPIVIAGGPAITNPLPFSPFFDFVFIGEAEAGLAEIVQVIRNGKHPIVKERDHRPAQGIPVPMVSWKTSGHPCNR